MLEVIPILVFRTLDPVAPLHLPQQQPYLEKKLSEKYFWSEFSPFFLLTAGRCLSQTRETSLASGKNPQPLRLRASSGRSRSSPAHRGASGRASSPTGQPQPLRAGAAGGGRLTPPPSGGQRRVRDFTGGARAARLEGREDHEGAEMA